MLSCWVRGCLSKKVAVVLSGCGYVTGSEVTETVASLISLQSHQAQVTCYAPPDLIGESARITRTDPVDWNKLTSCQYDALVIPGGYGVAKNLSNYAFVGKSNFVISDTLKRIIGQFHQEKKPIGAICISPLMVAKCVPHCTITLGDSDQASMDAARDLSATVVQSSNDEIVIDEKNSIVSTGAYMNANANHASVFAGVDKLVQAVLKRC